MTTTKNVRRGHPPVAGVRMHKQIAMGVPASQIKVSKGINSKTVPNHK